jgi:hypothetical protein
MRIFFLFDIPKQQAQSSFGQPVFTPHPPQGGAIKLEDFKSPLGDIGVEIDKRNWKNRLLKPPF